VRELERESELQRIRAFESSVSKNDERAREMGNVRELAQKEERERERERQRQALDVAQNKTMMAMRERQEAVAQATGAREECKQLQRQRVQPLENLVEQAQILNRPIFKFAVTLRLE